MFVQLDGGSRSRRTFRFIMAISFFCGRDEQSISQQIPLTHLIWGVEWTISWHAVKLTPENSFGTVFYNLFTR